MTTSPAKVRTSCNPFDQDPQQGRGSLDSVLGIASSICNGGDGDQENGPARPNSVCTIDSAVAEAAGPRTTPTLEMTAASMLLAAGTSTKALLATIPQKVVPDVHEDDAAKQPLPDSLLSPVVPSGVKKGEKPTEAYRRSDCLNEDDYDFVIIVRVSKTQLQQDNSVGQAATAASHAGAASLTTPKQPTVARRQTSKRRLIGSPSPVSRGALQALHTPGADGDRGEADSDSASESDSDALSNSSEGEASGDRPDSGDDSDIDSRRQSVGSRVLSNLSTWARKSMGSRTVTTATSRGTAAVSALEGATSVDHVSVTVASPAGKSRRRASGHTKRVRRRASSFMTSDDDDDGDDEVAAAGVTAPKLARRVTWSRLVVSSESDSDHDPHAARRPHDKKNALARQAPPSQGEAATPPATDNEDAGHEVVRATPARPLHKCAEVIAALRAAGLFAKRVRSLSRRTWLLKIRAPEWRLELEAERIHLRMRRRDGGWSRFKRSMRAAFVPNVPSASDDNSLPALAGDVEAGGTADGSTASLFHSSDRQTLIDHILRSSAREGGADLGENTRLGAYVTHMFPLHMQARLQELRNDWLAIWRPQRSQSATDRIGTVDQAVYAPRKLVDISAAAPPAPPLEQGSGARNGHAGSCCCLPCTSRGSSSTAPGKADKDADASPRRRHACCCCACIASCFCKCGRSCSRAWSRLLSQPLDRIAAYYGETVAFYFAWLEFYTQWLVLPAIAGLLLFLGQLYSGSLDIAYVPLFSLLMAVWTILFLEFWKRRNAVLAQRWGVLQYEDEEVVRPQFKGRWKQDVATGAVVRVYPPWKRALKYLVTLPVMLAFIAGIVLVMVLVFSTRDHVLRQFQQYDAAVSERDAIILWLNGTAPEAANVTLPPEPVLAIDLRESILSAWTGGLSGFLSSGTPTEETSPAVTAAAGSGTTTAADGSKLSLDSVLQRLSRFEAFFTSQHNWRWWLAMTVPPIAYGALMPLFDFVFNKIALLFNHWENHATESAYRNHRIAKVFFFRFMASFVSLFYYAFSPQHSLLTLFIQLAAFLIIGQLLGNVAEVGGATCKVWLRECRARRKVTSAEDSGLAEGRRGRRLLRHAQSQAWVEARLPQYDTFHDYAEMLIQFGYVTFFSWAFPLAPLCALFNNIIEMRSDAYKLCHLSQRPIAHKAGGIGVWYNVLVSMSILAVLTNCAHLALTSRQFRIYFPNMTDAQRLLLVFVFEHIVLSLRLLMAYIIPPVPAAVNRRSARDAWALAKLQGRRSVGELSTGGAAPRGDA